MRTGSLLLSGILFFFIIHGFRWQANDRVSGLPSSASPMILPVSVDDLKRSEKYLRDDLGLEESPTNPSEPLWEHSLEEHPIIIIVSGFLFIGGVIGFVITFRKHDKILSRGLEKIRENKETGGGFGYGAPPPFHSSQTIIDRHEEEIKNLPALSPEKALRKVDNVLDSLRLALGAGMKNSRLSLFRYDESDGHFRVCGFSRGEEFKALSPTAFPPKDVFGLPLRILTKIREKDSSKWTGNRWCFPFVPDTGEYCLLLLEIPSGDPPERWPDRIQDSMHLIKALITLQEKEEEDSSLLTKDSFGSLDYRATMNRLMEEWKRTERLGIPFAVIALRMENLEEYEKFYGMAPTELTWSKLIDSMKTTLRSTDWIMKPQRNLLLIQILEVSPSEGKIVMTRIVKSLARFSQSKKLEKGLTYKGVVMTHGPGSKFVIEDFFDEILRRIDEKCDFEGAFFYA